MGWTIQQVTDFSSIAELWDQVNERVNAGHPLLDSKFLGPLVDVFCHQDLYFCGYLDGAYTDVMLLEQGKPGTWRLFFPSQAPLGPMILDSKASDDEISAKFSSLFKALPGLVLQLGLPSVDPDFSPFSFFKDCKATELMDRALTTNIAIDDSFDSYWQARPKKLKQNMRRTYKKIDQEGRAVELKELNSHDDMLIAVSEHGRLESSGWKGEQGTAIHENNDQGRFYRKIMENFSLQGGARGYLLLLDGEVIASLLTIVQNKMLVVLKTTYDEAYADYSPGRLIDYEMLSRVFSHDAGYVVENYTNAGNIDTKWVTSVRTIVNVNYYRSSFARHAITILRKMRKLRS